MNIRGLILSLLLIFTFSCQQRGDKNQGQAAAIPVKVLKVKAADILETLEYTGDIKAQNEAIVYPKVSGKIIEKIKEDGSVIKKGQALAYIDRDEVGLKFEKAPVDSPLDGVVGRVYVDIGQKVTEQTPVAFVIDMDKVKINLEIPERYLPRISLGQEAKVSTDAYPQEEFLGQVTKVSPVVDLSTRSAPIEITIDNPKHFLKSGMFCRVELVINRYQNALAVLKEAVMGKAPDAYIFVVKDNHATLRKVTLGISKGPYYQVTEGLSPEELVVVMGQQILKDNSPVVTELIENNIK
ncbi:MAG: efflux RND transporter periplasmic adaptor subunit [Candidatus Omnitrophica bacterium]|jgi:multidrug efflux pump subunit AcrA (membrane-fusion protein)|nr:efflux RND transporter periplasmic adaptor subunit [Candidatus Omnitrophota bacterium]